MRKFRWVRTVFFWLFMKRINPNAPTVYCSFIGLIVDSLNNSPKWTLSMVVTRGTNKNEDKTLIPRSWRYKVHLRHMVQVFSGWQVRDVTTTLLGRKNIYNNRTHVRQTVVLPLTYFHANMISAWKILNILFRVGSSWVWWDQPNHGSWHLALRTICTLFIHKIK